MVGFDSVVSADSVAVSLSAGRNVVGCRGANDDGCCVVKRLASIPLAVVDGASDCVVSKRRLVRSGGKY